MVVKNNLKKLAADRGLSLTAIAELTGLSWGSISTMANNKSNYTQIMIGKICQALECKIEELLYLED